MDLPAGQDIERRFDPKYNELLRNGEAIRWLALDTQGRTVGRIAAFYNPELAAAADGQPTGWLRFLRIDRRPAGSRPDGSTQPKNGLAKKGMEAMDGPVNFGDRDQWWGLLTKGFEFTPLYTNPYNFEYYIRLFENYGFQNYFNQHTYLRELAEGLFPDNVYERVKRLQEEPRYSFEHMDKRKRSLQQYAEDFRTVYNKAWAKFTGVKPIEKAHALALMNSLRPIIDQRLMYFAYYDGEPIGFYLMIPDLNGVIAPLKGRFGAWDKLRFLWRLKVSRKATRIFALIFGVIPEFQGKGIESGMIYNFEQQVNTPHLKRYKSLELAWIGDFNPLMMRMVETLVCAKKHKMHTTYRYLFDREKPFTRRAENDRQEGLSQNKAKKAVELPLRLRRRAAIRRYSARRILPPALREQPKSYHTPAECRYRQWPCGKQQ